MGGKRLKEKDSVVKVDSELLKEIEDFINKNKYVYSSKKQVVNLALLEFLENKKGGKTEHE